MRRRCDSFNPFVWLILSTVEGLRRRGGEGREGTSASPWVSAPRGQVNNLTIRGDTTKVILGPTCPSSFTSATSRSNHQPPTQHQHHLQRPTLIRSTSTSIPFDGLITQHHSQRQPKRPSIHVLEPSTTKASIPPQSMHTLSRSTSSLHQELALPRQAVACRRRPPRSTAAAQASSSGTSSSL